MDKYFIFRKEEVTQASVSFSDSGVGVSIFAVPTDSVSYISAEKGKVIIVFNDATLYQDNNLRDGESLKKSTVAVGCKAGEEAKMVEDIVNFVTSKTPKNIMRFDVVESRASIGSADLTEPNSLNTTVSTRPINMQTGELSGYSIRQTEGSNTIVGAIDFGANQPIVDYNHTGLSTYSDGTEIGHSSNTWGNDGTGGSTYDITSNVGAPTLKDPATNDRGLAFNAVQFSQGDHFIVPSLSVENDYTLYLVFSTQYTASLFNANFFVMYGDAAGETLGPGGKFVEDGPVDKTFADRNTFSFRHSKQTGSIATTTTASPILDQVGDQGFEPCHVLVVRRDKDNNMIIHDRTGNVIQIIEAADRASFLGEPENLPSSTEGKLLIERLGTTADILANHFSKSTLARFGVISSDIGTNEAAKLAGDLFNLYKV